MIGPRDLLISRCESCHARFLPRPGSCPKCGSTSLRAQSVPPVGTVLAAVELETPSAGWTAPHRIALVELEESVRLLALVPGRLPAIGERVGVERDEDRYVVRDQTP